VHGVPGIVGALAIGIFADTDVNPKMSGPGAPGGDDGWIKGNAKLLAVQALAVVIAACWAGFWYSIVSSENFNIHMSENVRICFAGPG